MKTIKLLLTVVAITATMTTFAQVVAKDNVHGEQTQELIKQQKEKDLDIRKTGVEANFNFVDDGFVYGMAMIFNGFVIHSDFMSFYKEPEGVSSMSSWNLGAGYNYRHYFNRTIYVDARAGFEYSHLKFKYETGVGYEKEEVSDGNFGGYITPKIGIRIAKGFAIVAGYKVGIAKGGVGGNFTAGITFLSK